MVKNQFIASFISSKGPLFEFFPTLNNFFYCSSFYRLRSLQSNAFNIGGATVPKMVIGDYLLLPTLVWYLLKDHWMNPQKKQKRKVGWDKDACETATFKVLWPFWKFSAWFLHVACFFLPSSYHELLKIIGVHPRAS